VNLDFLTPVGSADQPARGALLEAAQAAGAICEVRDGWEMAVSFGDLEAEAAACAGTVGFADLSHLTKLELQSNGSPTLPELLDAELGGKARRIGEGGWLCAESPSLALALGAGPAAVAALGASVRVSDLTSSLGAVAIAGPLARDTIARFCALDSRERSLPVAGFRPISVARTPGFVLREAPDRFLILFGAAFGEYIWTVLADAAGHLGGRPVGLDALPAVEAMAHA